MGPTAPVLLGPGADATSPLETDYISSPGAWSQLHQSSRAAYTNDLTHITPLALETGADYTSLPGQTTSALLGLERNTPVLLGQAPSVLLGSGADYTTIGGRLHQFSWGPEQSTPVLYGRLHQSPAEEECPSVGLHWHFWGGTTSLLQG